MRHLRKSIKSAIEAITTLIALLLLSINDFNGWGAVLIIAIGWAIVALNIAIIKKSNEGWRA